MFGTIFRYGYVNISDFIKKKVEKKNHGAASMRKEIIVALAPTHVFIDIKICK